MKPFFAKSLWLEKTYLRSILREIFETLGQMEGSRGTSKSPQQCRIYWLYINRRLGVLGGPMFQVLYVLKLYKFILKTLTNRFLISYYTMDPLVIDFLGENSALSSFIHQVAISKQSCHCLLHFQKLNGGNKPVHCIIP